VDPYDGTDQMRRDEIRSKTAIRWLVVVLVLIIVSVVLYYATNHSTDCIALIWAIFIILVFIRFSGIEFDMDLRPSGP
jgi:hypothetical protein